MKLGYGSVDKNNLKQQLDPGMSRGEAESVAKLEVFPWEVFPDMAVFDWLIRLRDKDRSGVYHEHEGDGAAISLLVHKQ